MRDSKIEWRIPVNIQSTAKRSTEVFTTVARKFLLLIFKAVAPTT